MSSLRDQWRQMNFWLDQYMTRAVKWLILVNVGVLLVQAMLVLVEAISGATLGLEASFLSLLAQNPIVRFVPTLDEGYEIDVNWLCTLQFFTYMFVHAGLGHLFWNMLGLFFFGPPLESRWGTVAFLKFYLFTGFAAGALHGLIAPLLFRSAPIMYGASGAVFGVLLAFGLTFPEQKVLLWFVLPIPARVLAAVIGLLTLLSLLTGASPGVSHLTHLAGLGFGYLWLRLAQKYPNVYLFNNDAGPFARGPRG